MMNTRRISATVCGAALLAGAMTVPSASAATVGAPDENRVCEFQMNSEEKAHLASLELLEDAQYYQNAQLTAFENAFDDAKRVRDAYELDPAGFSGGTLAAESKKLQDIAGLTPGAANWYAEQYVTEDVDVSSNPSPDQEQLRDDVKRAVENGVIDAATDASAYNAGEPIPNKEGIRKELKAKVPSISDAELARWADTLYASEEIAKAKQALEFQAKFFKARQLCSLEGGIVALPTGNATNPDALNETDLPAPTAEGVNSDIKITVGYPYSVGDKADKGAEADQTDTVNVDAANAQTNASAKTDSEMTPGKIAGIVIGVLALLGILGGAAFAMMPR